MEESILERYRKHAGASGERMTPQKLAILKFLQSSTAHPTVQEIFASVKRKLGQTARVTVYRFMRELTRLGMVKPLCVDPDRLRFDARTEPHHHAVCRVCGRIVDIPPEAVTCQVEKIPQDFLVHGDIEVVVRGVCKRCAQKNV